MTINKQPSLGDVLDLLRALDDSSVEPDGATTQFLEIRKGANDEGACINGNSGGLIHLARLVLEIAGKGFIGAHQHFDDAGEMDICEVPLVISLKPAEWDVQ
jgi:hypothetical protein